MCGEPLKPRPLLCPAAKAGALPPVFAGGILDLCTLKEHKTYLRKHFSGRKTEDARLACACARARACARAGGAQRVSCHPCRATGHRPVASSNEQTVVGLPLGPPFRAVENILGSN